MKYINKIKNKYLLILVLAFAIFGWQQVASAKDINFTIGMGIPTVGKFNKLPYPLFFMFSPEFTKSFLPSVQTDESKDVPSNLAECTKSLNKVNQSKDNPGMSLVCVKNSSLPNHPKKFQSLAISKGSIQSFQGYKTFKACTKVHDDGTCYRFYIINSKAQMMNIMTSLMKG